MKVTNFTMTEEEMEEFRNRAAVRTDPWEWISREVLRSVFGLKFDFMVIYPAEDVFVLVEGAMLEGGRMGLMFDSSGVLLDSGPNLGLVVRVP